MKKEITEQRRRSLVKDFFLDPAPNPTKHHAAHKISAELWADKGFNVGEMLGEYIEHKRQQLPSDLKEFTLVIHIA